MYKVVRIEHIDEALDMLRYRMTVSALPINQTLIELAQYDKANMIEIL